MGNLDDYNYYMDRRVGAPDLLVGYDERAGTLTRTLMDDEGDEEEIEFPAVLAVCGLCNGKGVVVNPSIDCGGLTREDFDEDPDFARDYFRGVYDTSCPSCRGKRVVPEINAPACKGELKAKLEALREQEQADAYYEREARAERAMGA